ncbi:MAG: hypothetical protein AB3A66_11955 [Nodularia sp. CChRGM 3473]
MTTSALFTVSEYHATYGALSVLVAIPVFHNFDGTKMLINNGALSVLVAIPVFLAIAYGVFKRKALTRFPELPQDRR